MSEQEIIYAEQKNKGLGGARNTAIKNSTGEILAFIDQDDIWYPGKLEIVKRIYDGFKDVDVVCHNCYVSRNGRIIGAGVKGYNEKDMHRAMLFKGNRLTTLTTTFKKSLVDRVGYFSEDRENLHFVEDYDLWLRMAYAGCKFYFIQEYLAEYVQHSNSISQSNLDRMCESELFVLKKHYKMLKKRTLLDCYLLRRREAETMFLPARKYLFSGRYFVKGLRYLFATFSADPLFGFSLVSKTLRRIKNYLFFKKGDIV